MAGPALLDLHSRPVSWRMRPSTRTSPSARQGLRGTGAVGKDGGRSGWDLTDLVARAPVDRDVGARRVVDRRHGGRAVPDDPRVAQSRVIVGPAKFLQRVDVISVCGSGE